MLRMLNDFVNNVDNKMVVWVILGYVVISVVILKMSRINDDEGTWSDLEEISKWRKLKVFVVFGLGLVMFCMTVVIIWARKSPAYVEKSAEIDYVDNQGVFGNGYGSIDQPTLATSSVVIVDGEPFVMPTPIAPDTVMIDGMPHDLSLDPPGEPFVMKDDVTAGKNDDLGPEPGPIMTPSDKLYSTDFKSYEEYKNFMNRRYRNYED